MLETMDVQGFLNNPRQFDQVTQKQCLLKARRELLKPGTLKLHGPKATRKAMAAISEVVERAQN